ncbi:unnamed protein product [Rotaria sordida]|uniref:Uncharacterized protein n=1 Tax=Rotaria sordida TaxID=392033 RepID=A0A819TUJ4_9BILA|nr:unnamed protein product [Rotaria sordida]
MPPGPLEVASVYVPLSRVKRLDDILIIRPFEFATLQVKPSTAQIEELKRLDKIAQKKFDFCYLHEYLILSLQGILAGDIQGQQYGWTGLHK